MLMAEYDQYSGQSLERPEDAGEGQEGVVKRWLMEIELAEKGIKKWREEAVDVLKQYRAEEKEIGEGPDIKDKLRGRFNILWANVELLRPALYSHTPNPDIRRRFRQKDPIGRELATGLERVCTYLFDEYKVDTAVKEAIKDYLLPGLGCTRVRYQPAFTEDGQTIADEWVEFEHVQHDMWGWGPGKVWKDVPFIWFEHTMRRNDLIRVYGEELGNEVKLDVSMVEDSNKDPDKREQTEKDLFDRGRVYEIWDRETRQVIHIAPSYPKSPLRVEPPPVVYKWFYPIPTPLRAISTTNTLVPIPEYRMYREQAEELDQLTERIQRLTNALRANGLYDSTISEMQDLIEGRDNEMIPTTKAMAALAGSNAKSLDDLIWMFPVREIAMVIVQLEERRASLKQVIYEITGLSDVLRGATDPRETLGAQQIKTQTGSLRLQERQGDVARYVRELLEMTVQIVCTKFQPDTISMILGEDGLSSDAWMMVQNHQLREYRLDIETDSTIAVDHQRDQETVSTLLTGVVEFMNAAAPAIESGILTPDVAKTMLLSAVRRFRLGRELENAIDELGAEDEAQPEGAPDPMLVQQIQQETAAQLQEQMAGEMQALEQGKAEIDVGRQKMDADRAAFDAVRSTAEKELELSRRSVALEQQEAENALADKMLKIEKAQIELDRLNGTVTNGMAELDNRTAEVTNGEQRLDEVDAQVKEMAQAVTMLAQAMQQASQAQTEMLQAILQAQSAPREVVRDQNGRPTGVRMVMQ